MAAESWEHNGKAGRQQMSIRRRSTPAGELEVTVFTPGRRYRTTFVDYTGKHHENAVVELLSLDSQTAPVEATCRLLGSDGYATEMQFEVLLDGLAEAER
jgi:hypothetical protein